MVSSPKFVSVQSYLQSDDGKLVDGLEKPYAIELPFHISKVFKIEISVVSNDSQDADVEPPRVSEWEGADSTLSRNLADIESTFRCSTQRHEKKIFSYSSNGGLDLDDSLAG